MYEKIESVRKDAAKYPDVHFGIESVGFIQFWSDPSSGSIRVRHARIGIIVSIGFEDFGLRTETQNPPVLPVTWSPLIHIYKDVGLFYIPIEYPNCFNFQSATGF